MSNKLIDKATDPNQYDFLNWELDGLANSPRTNVLAKYILADHGKFKDKDILDIGSGTGWLLEGLHKAGARSVVGIEPSKKNVAIARKEHPKFETIHTSLQDFEPENKFDTIISIHVMLHIEDIVTAMKKIAGMLKAGGEYIQVTPDFEYARTQRHGYNIEIEDINNNEYVVATERPNGTITDIIRRPEIYENTAKAIGLTVVAAESIFPDDKFVKAKNAGTKFSKTRIAILQRFLKNS